MSAIYWDLLNLIVGLQKQLKQTSSSLIEVQVLWNILESKPEVAQSFPVGSRTKHEYANAGLVLVNVVNIAYSKIANTT